MADISEISEVAIANIAKVDTVAAANIASIYGINFVSEFYSETIGESLRFEDGDSAYLNRTPSSAGNQRNMTFSAWIKRGNFGRKAIFSAGVSSDDYDMLEFTASDQIRYVSVISNIQDAELISNAVYRDIGSWYHIVVAINTAEGTASNRCRIYVNGNEITSWATENTATSSQLVNWTDNVAHYVGQYINSAILFDGYMSDVYFIDGSQLTPGSFGEESSGVWIPKAYSGSYGTTGFHLDFADSGDIGNDVSGNGNDFTPNNLVSTDVTPDTPTNNWCTLNSIQENILNTFSEGNLKLVHTGSNAYRSDVSTFGVSAGKWYWEAKITNQVSLDIFIGIASASRSDMDANLWTLSTDYAYRGYNGQKYNNGAGSTYGDTYTTGDIISVALDLDNGKIWWAKNGTWQASGDPAAGTNEAFSGLTGSFVAAVQHYATNDGIYFNFGQDSINVATGNVDDNGYGNFEYDVPAGFLTLCSANLIALISFTAYTSCGTEDEDGQVTYTGNGSVDGPFIFCGGCPEDICIDGTHYDRTSSDFDFLSNGIKVRSATTKNTLSTVYTLEYWLETEFKNDFKYANAQIHS